MVGTLSAITFEQCKRLLYPASPLSPVSSAQPEAAQRGANPGRYVHSAFALTLHAVRPGKRGTQVGVLPLQHVQRPGLLATHDQRLGLLGHPHKVASMIAT